MSKRAKWKDRHRLYLLIACEGSDARVLIETEREINRLYKTYKEHVTLKSFIEWMKEMELCRVVGYEEFKIG